MNEMWINWVIGGEGFTVEFKTAESRVYITDGYNSIDLSKDDVRELMLALSSMVDKIEELKEK